MGGEIGVESEPGTGSTFWFSVPWEQPPQGLALAAPRTDLTGLRALVVDDNQTNRRLLRYHLTAWGVASDEAIDGPHALAQLHTATEQGQPYDFALLDFMMPSMDGMELGRTIKADPLLRQTKLLLLTSTGERGDGQRARAAGLEDYLTKPVRQEHLWGCLTTLMGRRAASASTPPPLVMRHTVKETNGQKRPLILVADDNSVNQKLAVRLLDKLGYRADIVANGLEAVAATEQIPYVAVLMDCQMPEMDGYAATRAIRHRETSTQTARPAPGLPLPIIAMTANAMVGDREACLEAGMTDYVSKPLKPADLKAVLARWAPLLEQEHELFPGAEAMRGAEPCHPGLPTGEKEETLL
jgi:CheY-like chemotaxis protein